MKWYEQDSKIRFDMPVFAKKNGVIYLLLPQIAKESKYKVVGYNWFNVTDGDFNSCCFYNTPEDAIESYSKLDGYEIYNKSIL